MVPTWIGKPGKKGKIFPVREMSGNFEQIGKVREFYPKCWKRERILASFYFYFFSNFLIEVSLLNRFLYLLNSLNETLKKYWKIEKKIGKVSEICQSEKVGTTYPVQQLARDQHVCIT